MSENDLLTLFEKLNIETGELSPRDLKAWFDTDCENLLKWMCSSITEECYLSAQEEAEYSQLDNVLTPEQLNKKMKELGTEYPDMFQVDENLFDIVVAKDTIEILEEDLRDCDHQIQVNQQLKKSLLIEFSTLSAKEIQSEVEEEQAQECCSKLSKELDKINKHTYEQIQKNSLYLSNYEYQTEFPLFANNIDTTEFEEKFADITSDVNSVAKIENDVFEMSAAEELSELESRIFNTRISQLALQMEIEGLKSTSNFLESFDLNTFSSFIDHDIILKSVELSEDQQTSMVKVIEETSLKLAEQLVNQPTLRCLRNELNFIKLNLNFLNQIKNSLMNIFLHFITIHGLYLQEKMDINSLSQFFMSINKYINGDLQESKFRKGAMLKLISQFKDFCLAPIENKFKLMGDFSTILLRKKSAPLRQILDETNILRTNVERLKKQHSASFVRDRDIIVKTRKNVQVLQDFLICGPTYQIVTIPLSLQMLLFSVNQNLSDQNSSVKSLVQVAQKPKERFSKDKWLRYQNQLWTYFMTNGTKMLTFLDEIKSESHLKEENQQYEKEVHIM